MVTKYTQAAKRFRLTLSKWSLLLCWRCPSQHCVVLSQSLDSCRSANSFLQSATLSQSRLSIRLLLPSSFVLSVKGYDHPDLPTNPRSFSLKPYPCFRAPDRLYIADSPKFALPKLFHFLVRTTVPLSLYVVAFALCPPAASPAVVLHRGLSGFLI